MPHPNLAVDDKAFEILRKYSWPGNIRELKNVLTFALYSMEEGCNVLGAAIAPTSSKKASPPRRGPRRRHDTQMWTTRRPSARPRAHPRQQEPRGPASWASPGPTYKKLKSSPYTEKPPTRRAGVKRTPAGAGAAPSAPPAHRDTRGGPPPAALNHREGFDPPRPCRRPGIDLHRVAGPESPRRRLPAWRPPTACWASGWGWQENGQLADVLPRRRGRAAVRRLASPAGLGQDVARPTRWPLRPPALPE